MVPNFLNLPVSLLGRSAPKDVVGLAMMGFLNKFMDAMGVELEADAVSDVSALISPTGWAVGQHGWAEGSLDAAEHLTPAEIVELAVWISVSQLQHRLSLWYGLAN